MMVNGRIGMISPPTKEVCDSPHSVAFGYSCRSATIGSTRAALCAGIQHATMPVATNNATVLARVIGS
jgi:hypothetical protein